MTVNTGVYMVCHEPGQLIRVSGSLTVARTQGLSFCKYGFEIVGFPFYGLR